MASADYISREYVLKCMEDSYKNAGISAEAKAKMTRWLKNAPAADAIENLSVVVRAQKAVLDKFPKWIPVTEQLIHSGWYLVVCNEWGGSAVRKAIYDEATRKWLEFPCGGTKDITKFVTHWMPLPEPPKEET